MQLPEWSQKMLHPVAIDDLNSYEKDRNYFKWTKDFRYPKR